MIMTYLVSNLQQIKKGMSILACKSKF